MQRTTQLSRVVPHRRGRLALRILVVSLVFCVVSSFLYFIFPPPNTDILILGVDARPGQGMLTRTDSIMLLGIRPRQMRVSLLSIPRDLFVEVPGYGFSQRINTINVLGEQQAAGNGPKLVQDSIAQSFGVQPDRYVRLDFQGFVELINAVGGVTIDVERSIVDQTFPTADGGTQVVRFEPGTEHMDGERALIYARTRHADDDYFRAGRQQQVVEALGRKLINPLNWPAALNVLNSYVETDLNIFDMLTLAPPVILSGGDFEQLVIDRNYILPTEGGARPNYEALAPWLSENFD